MVGHGSEWHRWEPHIHAPGTILNNQFGGADPWGAYLTTLEGLTPPIEAIAVTDYYVTDTYEEFLKHKVAGRLPGVQLLFPNIELRLDVAAKSGFVNIHLLVSPEDSDHLAEVNRVLKRLQFGAHSDRFDCTRDELIKLGKRADPAIINDGAALRHGATQFKVNFDQLRRVIHESEWAKKNILIAVAGGVGDGTSGLRQAADTTVRQEIEKFAHIIFTSSPAQREFWLGQRPGVTIEELRTRYDGRKPCLHGSDSHDQKSVGQPVDNRFSWIKGALEFDTLRQACIDPEGRAYVGEQPLRSAMPSQVVSHVRIDDADWAVTPDIPLNPGLVAIIGARGSGKTALADVIAAGCDAISPSGWDADENISPSFLARARRLIGDATTTLTWGGGATLTRSLDGRDANSHMSFPRARYLSQQFVEELCSAKGVSDGLVDEVERVIFESHSQDDRDGAIDFAELRDQQTVRFQQARKREAEAISDISERIGTELEKESLVTTLTTQVGQKKKLIADYNADLAKLVVKGTEAQVGRHTQLSEAAQQLRGKIQALGNQRRTFVALQDEVRSMRATRAPEMLRQAQARHANGSLNARQWDEFLLIYKGDVDKSLTAYIAWADQEVAKLNGIPPTGDPNVQLIADNAALAALPLAPIAAEMTRLEALFSADKLVRDQYSALTRRIAQETSALQTLETRLTDAQGAATRRKDLQTERDDTYGRIFEAIITEQNALAALYAPLMARLAASTGTLKKLSFSVRRIADVEEWGSVAEEKLLDRRKAGSFYGRGSLIAVATQALKPAWEAGSAAEVQAAMTAFMGKYLKDLLSHAPYAPAQQVEFRAWSKQFAHWLFNTDHISVRYEISYDGVDIRKLSPGTRGIVLLLLYLALDDSDDRLLIIDQPEENLDPKSVFDELVKLFIAAKAKRQVIIVTHNANLVINTDADQIIVAEAGPHPFGGLPPISYVAGGLEDAAIRKAVCDILEGGEVAFRERARRLRVRLAR
jgi:hypothetical protein